MLFVIASFRQHCSINRDKSLLSCPGRRFKTPESPCIVRTRRSSGGKKPSTDAECWQSTTIQSKAGQADAIPSASALPNTLDTQPVPLLLAAPLASGIDARPLDAPLATLSDAVLPGRFAPREHHLLRGEDEAFPHAGGQQGGIGQVGADAVRRVVVAEKGDGSSEESEE